MTNNRKDPFDGLILDEEEQAIEAAIERGEFEDVVDLDSSKKMIEEAANRYLELNKTKPITIRIKQTDIIKIKAKAKRSNIPYQTLLGAAIHDFADGKRDLVIK
jgi:predicted DNA binding CopG/RHH family protein